MIGRGHLEHRLMLVGVERQTDCGDAGDAVPGEDLFELTLGRFEAEDEALHALVLDRINGARKVVRHAQNIPRKAGCGIGARFVLFALQTAAHILGFGLGIKHFLPRRLKIALQRFERFGERRGLIAALAKVFGHTLQFVFRRLIQRRVVIGHVVWLPIQAISLPSDRAVKSTMGTTRA